MKRKIIALTGIAILFASCVSSRKYNTALDQKQDLNNKLENLEQDIAALTNERDSLNNKINYVIAQSSDVINKTQEKLEQKEQELQKKEKTLADMRKALNLQQEAVVNLKSQVCDALKCYTPDELSVEVRNGKLYVSLSDKLLFPSGSDNVNKRGKEAISMLSEVLINSDMEIMVEGHTDSVPINTSRNKDNWDLSVHRATSVTRLLTENGIDPKRIIASGRSKYHPLASNNQEEGRKFNRRTDVVLAPKLDKLWELTDNYDTPNNILNNQNLSNNY